MWSSCGLTNEESLSTVYVQGFTQGCSYYKRRMHPYWQSDMVYLIRRTYAGQKHSRMKEA